MQALSLADASVSDELQCAICFELMSHPVSLKCQHSFCTSCIQRTAAQNGSLHCPLCRKRSHSVESLTENKMLRVMCDLAKEARDAQCPSHAGHVMEYATRGSNPGLADRVPGWSATHTCAPCLGQLLLHDLRHARVRPVRHHGLGAPWARDRATGRRQRQDTLQALYSAERDPG